MKHGTLITLNRTLAVQDPATKVIKKASAFIGKYDFHRNADEADYLVHKIVLPEEHVLSTRVSLRMKRSSIVSQMEVEL